LLSRFGEWLIICCAMCVTWWNRSSC
jgi:hypothetical protein